MAITSLRVLGHKGRAVLVEQEGPGVLERAYIPDDAPVTAEEFERGIPYGDDLAAGLQDVSFDVQAFELALHRRGIWTHDQLLRNPSAVRAAAIEGAARIISTVLGGGYNG